MPLLSRYLLSGVLTGAALAAGPALAQTKSLDAHVHGQAELSFAAENGEIYVELHSPMVNFAGFEHAPETAEQKAAYDSAIQTLRAGEFLSFAGGGCALDDVALETPDFGEAGHHAGEDHDHEGEDHDHEAGHDDADAHASLNVSYRYDCGDLGKLTEIRVGLFESFEGLREIAVVYLGDTTRAETLTPGRNVLNLDR